MLNSSDPRCSAPAQIQAVEDEAGTKGLESKFYIGAPADFLLDMLWDTKNFSTLFPDIKAFSIVGQGDDWLDIDYRIDAVDKEFHYILRREIDRSNKIITWREMSGDLKRVRGRWQADDTEQREVSLLTYAAFVDVGWFIPTRLVRGQAMRKMGEMVDRVRRFVAKTYSPLGD